jgi:hypothetical protein
MRIRNVVLLVSCILIPVLVYWVYLRSGDVTPVPIQITQSQQVGAFIPCTHTTVIQQNNLTPIVNELECIFAEYSVLAYAKENKKGKLLEFDNELRQLVMQIHTLEPADLWLMLWDDKYKKLGLYNEGGLQYTGQLKDEADGKPVAWSPLYKKVSIKLTPAQQEKYGRIETLLARIHAQYAALPTKPESAEKLFALDGEIRHLVKEIKQSGLGLPVIRDDDIGLYDGNGQRYTGKLMHEADTLLPPYVPASVRSSKYIPVPGEKFTGLKDAIEHIYAEHSALTMKPDDANKLVLLDQEIKNKVAEIVDYYPFLLSQKFWEKKY